MSARTSTITFGKRAVVALAIALIMSVGGCGTDPARSLRAMTAPGSSPTATHSVDAGVATRLDAAINATMEQAGVPGAIVGIWGPDGDYVKAFGVADEVTGARMETDFFQRIGSQTKTFTITALLQLAGQGTLRLDDPIAKYLDGVPHGEQITLRMLARMQSGLVNYSATEAFQQALIADPHRAFTPQQLLKYAFAEPMVFPPGQGFLYCNTNTVLLGLVVEKLSGQPLPDYVHDHILVPLGMKDTAFPTTNAFPLPHAQGYTNTTADGSRTTATDWNPSWGWSAGAMTSTLHDMHIWAPALATGTLLTPQMQQERLQTVGVPGMPSSDGYGLGIFNLSGWIGHNGSLPGYQTVSAYLPEKQTAVIIFTNTDIAYHGNEPSTLLAAAITTIVSPDHVYRLGGDAQDPGPPPTPSTTTKPR
jgi:D-alanyl-D-alanine carboxypeptidase